MSSGKMRRENCNMNNEIRNTYNISVGKCHKKINFGKLWEDHSKMDRQEI